MIGNRKKNKKSGFTLIEVIAVLVILAVLAAVAIPRYISLIDDARDKALDGAVAAGLSHVSLTYGRLCLANGAEPTLAALATAATATPPSGADYTYTFTADASGITVVATETKADPRSATKSWVKP